MRDHVDFAARTRELASFNGGHAAQCYVSAFSVYFVHGNISDPIAAPLVDNVVALRYDILASFFLFTMSTATCIETTSVVFVLLPSTTGANEQYICAY